MTTALFAMTLDPNVQANFVSSGQNFSSAMSAVMTRVLTTGDINWATVSTPTNNAYRKVASLWNRIIPIDKNIIIAGQLFPRSK